MYDPLLGRFLSPDNYVQLSDFSQSFNRYSYCLNNPLKYTDPSGEFLFTAVTAISETFNNLFRHGVHFGNYSYSRTKIAAKIDNGLVTGNLMQVLNKLTFGLKNTIYGNTIANVSNWLGLVDNVSFQDGAIAISGVTCNGTSAFTVGPYIMGPKNFTADWRDHLFVHEYGHYLQSQFIGLFYIPVVAAPSLVSFLTDNEHHRDRWYEKNATILGGLYFDKKYGSESRAASDRFDYGSYIKGYKTSYINPRTNTNNGNKPINKSKTKHLWMDLLISYLSIYLL